MTKVEITQIGTGNHWLVDAPYYDSTAKIEIPAGFKTDLASIPRILWSIIAPFELSLAAPIVHDYLYNHAGLATNTSEGLIVFTRKEADVLLYKIALREGVKQWRCNCAYYAVRLVAWIVWRRNKASNVTKK
jgi:hypothetical protein